MLVDAYRVSEAIWEEKVGMLISQDLMRHLARFVEPPAQLCLIRILGSDHEYVFRVRYGDAHLDYPFTVPLFDSAEKVELMCNWDEIAKALTVMSVMVVPPSARSETPINYRNYNGRKVVIPQVLAPMSSEQFHFWQ